MKYFLPLASVQSDQPNSGYAKKKSYGEGLKSDIFNI